MNCVKNGKLVLIPELDIRKKTNGSFNGMYKEHNVKVHTTAFIDGQRTFSIEVIDPSGKSIYSSEKVLSQKYSKSPIDKVIVKACKIINPDL